MAVAEAELTGGFVPGRLDLCVLLPPPLLGLLAVGEVGGQMDGKLEARHLACVVAQPQHRTHAVADEPCRLEVDRLLRQSVALRKFFVGEKGVSAHRTGRDRTGRLPVDADFEARQQASVVDVQAERILLIDASGQIGDQDTSPRIGEVVRPSGAQVDAVRHRSAADTSDQRQRTEQQRGRGDPFAVGMHLQVRGVKTGGLGAFAEFAGR